MRFHSSLFVVISLLSRANAFTSGIGKRTFITSLKSATMNEISAIESEALEKFFSREEIEGIGIKPAEGGVSNRMSFITVGDERYLLRIYNNGVSYRRSITKVQKLFFIVLILAKSLIHFV